MIELYGEEFLALLDRAWAQFEKPMGYSVYLGTEPLPQPVFISNAEVELSPAEVTFSGVFEPGEEPAHNLGDPGSNVEPITQEWTTFPMSMVFYQRGLPKPFRILVFDESSRQYVVVRSYRSELEAVGALTALSNGLPLECVILPN